MRRILLVEPGYKTKFPPLGLMKISNYHKMLDDNVKFVKGIIKDESVAMVDWDRIYISTLFTYHWKTTVEAINYYKSLVNDDITKIYIGGILATLMPNELAFETGITPIERLLDKPGILGDDNEMIVDDLIPDYDLFKKPHKQLALPKFGKDEDELIYNYSLIKDSYFGYATRGCKRRCEFCGVYQLEPKFIHYKDIKPYVEGIKKNYEEKAHLVLFDNNILASKKLKQIIADIRDLGFEKGGRIELKNRAGQRYAKLRYVDLNQGVDARLMTESKVKLLSKIAVNPLRIAFDHISDKDLYIEKVRLAAKYGLRDLSNYILYNFDDTPEDLWQRLKINIDLNKELDLKIYSFPMKYIPLCDKDRSFINRPKWNWQYIRGVQRILNVLKGSVMTSKGFFFRAFGKDEKEFLKILHMPENILLFRGKKPGVLEKQWMLKFDNLTDSERKDLLEFLCKNRTENQIKTSIAKTNNKKLKDILEYYLLSDAQVKSELYEDNLN